MFLAILLECVGMRLGKAEKKCLKCKRTFENQAFAESEIRRRFYRKH